MKTEPPITRENEKETKKVINRDRVTLTAGHLTYTAAFGTQSNLAEGWMLPHPLGYETEGQEVKSLIQVTELAKT